jgi:cytochrome c-type biogenesis protein CcmH
VIGLVAAAALLGLLTFAWLAWPRRPSAAPGAAAAPAASADPSASLGLRIGLGVALLVVTAGGYALWGTPAALTPGITHADPLAAANALPPEQREKLLRALIKDREREVERAPGDAAAWSALARTQFEAAQVPQAVESFRRAVQLRPQDADSLVDLADVLAVQAERRMSPESIELIDRALAIDANHTKALALAGIAAFQRGDPAQAVAAWQRAIATAPEGHPIAAELKATLDQARQMAQAGAPGAAGGPGAGAQAGGGPGPTGTDTSPSPASTAPAGAEAITGRISIAPALAARAQPDDTVFVFARPAEGSRMPLAIQRHRVRDLPLEFTLDDRHAMSPAARLSSVPSVVVGARVSRSGNATPQPGDLQGVSAAVTPGAKGITIVIGDEVTGR